MKTKKRAAKKQSNILSGNFDLTLAGPKKSKKQSKQKTGRQSKQMGIFDGPGNIINGHLADDVLSGSKGQKFNDITMTPPSEFLR